MIYLSNDKPRCCNVSDVDIREVSHHYSPLLRSLCSTGQPGQHQHHPAVLPWSPPDVSRGITPGGRTGGPAGVQSSRCVSNIDIQGTLQAMHCHLVLTVTHDLMLFSVFLRFPVQALFCRGSISPRTKVISMNRFCIHLQIL